MTPVTRASALAALDPEPPRWRAFDRMRWRRKVREVNAEWDVKEAEDRGEVPFAMSISGLAPGEEPVLRLHYRISSAEPE